jgi:hypothetical protein
LAVVGENSTYRLRSEFHALDLAQPEHSPTTGGTIDQPSVIDDLPEVIPVTGPELDVIETYLGNLIDQFLLNAASDRTVTLASASTGFPALDRD